MQFRASVLAVLAATAASANAGRPAYDIPDELFFLFGYGGQGNEVSSADASGASCTYPASYTVSHVQTWKPVAKNETYISFQYDDTDTAISTRCSFNATSVSLTEGTDLRARYPCDNDIVSFIWQPAANKGLNSTSNGKLTAIEVTCPGQTDTKFEASGSLLATGMSCAKSSNSSATELSTGAGFGTLCSANASIEGTFSSMQPSPLK